MGLLKNIFFKGLWSYFSKLNFLLREESSLQSCKLKILVEKLFGYTKQFCVLQLPVSYCVTLIIVIIISFQMEYFSAVKFDQGYEKNTSFLVISKSPQV